VVQVDLFGRVPEVFVDIHEVTNRRKETSITLFLKMLEKEGVYYQVRKLPVADIIFPQGIGIERKTVKDFCQSLFGDKSGRLRLKKQIEALVENFKKPILLLEGGLSVRLDPVNKSIFVPIERRRISDRLWNVIEEQIRIHPNQYEGALKYVESLGVRVIKTYNEYHGALILLSLYREIKGRSKEREYVSKGAIRAKPKFNTIYEQQLFFLSGLPGINIIRAQKLLEVYDTPFNAIMKVTRWDIDVEGIGEKTIDRVKKVLLTPWKKAREERGE